eukprot:TRINITY_DN4420_c0_g1_i2.p1 TRINITY_DN4420_c0_g1~~TRINITY_DN4420_c0_g1_i2.p1  ORF type:complete len:883 (+),score=250.00 TRINITY_DN4420_c0_g1_i2:75-2723(+)
MWVRPVEVRSGFWSTLKQSHCFQLQQHRTAHGILGFLPGKSHRYRIILSEPSLILMIASAADEETIEQHWSYINSVLLKAIDWESADLEDLIPYFRLKFEAIAKDHEPTSRTVDGSEEIFQTTFNLPNEKLITYFGCSLYKTMHRQGWMYVSQHFVCFQSQMMTELISFPFRDVKAIQKENALWGFSSGIKIDTVDQELHFGTFLKRDEAFAILEDLWQRHMDARVKVSSSDVLPSSSVAVVLNGVGELATPREIHTLQQLRMEKKRNQFLTFFRLPSNQLIVEETGARWFTNGSSFVNGLKGKLILTHSFLCFSSSGGDLRVVIPLSIIAQVENSLPTGATRPAHHALVLARKPEHLIRIALPDNIEWVFIYNSISSPNWNASPAVSSPPSTPPISPITPRGPNETARATIFDLTQRLWKVAQRKRRTSVVLRLQQEFDKKSHAQHSHTHEHVHHNYSVYPHPPLRQTASLPTSPQVPTTPTIPTDIPKLDFSKLNRLSSSTPNANGNSAKISGSVSPRPLPTRSYSQGAPPIQLEDLHTDWKDLLTYKDEIPFFDEHQQKQKQEWQLYFSHYGNPGPCMALEIPKLEILIENGCPEHFRPAVWQISSGALNKYFNSPNLYKEILGKHEIDCEDPKTCANTLSIDDIDKDLHRSFPQHSFFQKKENLLPLRRILVAYSLYNPAVGYCQSMNVVTALLLLIVGEEAAFWLLASICEDLVPEQYSKQLIGSIADRQFFEELATAHLPDEMDKLQAVGISIGILTYPWFMCLFIGYLPLEACCRVLDIFLFSGRKILFQMGLAILKYNSSFILEEKDPVTLMSIIKDRVYEKSSDLLQIAIQDYADIEVTGLEFKLKAILDVEEHNRRNLVKGLQRTTECKFSS